MAPTSLTNQVTPADAAHLAGRGQIPYSYIVWDDGSLYHADSMIGTQDYPSADHTDATAIIQSAIQAVFNAGGGVIAFAPGTYKIAGAFQASGDGNTFGQILIPNNATSKIIHISFVCLAGSGLASLEEGSTINYVAGATSAAVLYSQAAGLNGNYYIMMAAFGAGSFYGSNVNAVILYFNGIVFRVAQNKTLKGLDGFFSFGINFGTLGFDTDNTGTVNTNADAFNWATNGTQTARQHGNVLNIAGYKNGLVSGLVKMDLEQLNVTGCTNALTLSGSGGTGNIGEILCQMIGTAIISVPDTTHTFTLNVGLISQADGPNTTIVSASGATLYLRAKNSCQFPLTMTNILPTNGFIELESIDANSRPAASGVLTAGGSPFTIPELGYSRLFVLQAANGLSSATLDGVTITLTTNVPILVKAGHALILTWTVTAPTYKVVPQ